MTEILKLQAENEPESNEDAPFSTISTACCGPRETVE